MTPTRGERNRNPGNLNYIGASPWRGQLGIELIPAGMSFKPRFGWYDTPENGIRALAKQLLAYQQRNGLRTIRAIIGKWAPPSDHNATDAYVGAVCNHCNITPDDDYRLTDLGNLRAIVFAIIVQENGRCAYPDSLIDAACADALA